MVGSLQHMQDEPGMYDSRIQSQIDESTSLESTTLDSQLSSTTSLAAALAMGDSTLDEKAVNAMKVCACVMPPQHCGSPCAWLLPSKYCALPLLVVVQLHQPPAPGLASFACFPRPGFSPSTPLLHL